MSLTVMVNGIPSRLARYRALVSSGAPHLEVRRRIGTGSPVVLAVRGKCMLAAA